MADKTNIQYLRDIFKEIQDDKMGEEYRNKLFTEVEEFLDAAEQEFKNMIVKDVGEKDIDEDEDDDDEKEPHWDSVHLGLDTFQYALVNGNLAIQQEVEVFVKRMEKKYIGVTA